MNFESWFCLKTLSLFPTYVGVIPDNQITIFVGMTFSHMRGSVPINQLPKFPIIAFFPHTWECTWTSFYRNSKCNTFPTRVGVVPCMKITLKFSHTFSHASGSSPYIRMPPEIAEHFFPRKWE